MDQAIDSFLVTVGIVAGILSPIAIIAILILFGGVLSTIGGKLQIKAEELRTAPPYDDVEVNVNPMTRVMTVRFLKNGVAIWQGSATRNEIEEAPADKGVSFTRRSQD